MRRGCGWLIAIATTFLGIFFWPLWLQTIVGVLMALLGGRRK